MSFRVKDLKNIFLTYPQCPVPPCALLDFLKDLLGDNLDCACISQELHQDGNQHLHAFVQLKERIRLGKEKFAWYFDLNYDDPCYHPNTQAARNVRNVVNYVVKGRFNGAMQDFVEYNMSAQAVLAKKAPKADKIAKMIDAGKSLKECFTEEPGYVAFNLAKIQYFQSWHATQQTKSLDSWNIIDLTQFQSTSSEYLIATWLNANVKQKRPPRTKHLMLVGPTRVGKTYLTDILRNYLRVYDCPAEGPYFPRWEDGLYDLVIIDELRGGWKPPQLLAFLGGSPTMLKTYGAMNFKTDNVPVIITSNQTFRESYKNVNASTIVALEDRVQVIELEVMFNVFPGIAPKL